MPLVMAVCAVFAVSAALGGCLGVHLRVPESRIGFDRTAYNNMLDRGAEAASTPETLDRTFVREHALHWIDHLPAEVSFAGVRASDVSRPRVEVVEGRAQVSELVDRTWVVRFHVEAASACRLRVNLYRFPGWTVRVDGATVPILEVPKQQRVIFFEVPPGPHEVQVVFERTFPRRLGDGLTLAGLAALAVVGLWPFKEREAL
jgi:hypothetical protein